MRPAVVGEQPLPAAENDRLDHEPVLVHEVVADQRAGQAEAAHDLQVATALLAQALHGADKVITGNQCCPRQVSLREGTRDDVLVDLVHLIGEGVTGAGRPCGGHHLPGTPAEQERTRGGHGLADG
jgi:hypothetical protein